MRQAWDYVTRLQARVDGVRYLPEHVLSPEQVSVVHVQCSALRTQSTARNAGCGGPGTADKYLPTGRLVYGTAPLALPREAAVKKTRASAVVRDL
jgi:cobalamin biosynthesis Mg chelatase CobN